MSCTPPTPKGSRRVVVSPRVLEVIECIVEDRMTKSVPLDPCDYQRYRHPSDWFRYCRDCGDLRVVGFPDTCRLEPIGTVWRARGWHCYNCEGDVWWVRDELHSAIFVRNVPMYYHCLDYSGPDFHLHFPGPGGRDRLNLRMVSWCLWCDDLMTDDGKDWNHMMCKQCVERVSALINGTLNKVYRIPKRAAIDIELFLLTRGCAE